MTRRMYRAGVAVLSAVLVAGIGLANLPAARATAPRTASQPHTSTAPSVTALATPHGVTVAWHHAPKNATTFTISRTDSSGNTVTLNKGRHSGKAYPVSGQMFVDTTATPGQTYTYTVTVGSVKDANSSPHGTPQPAASVGTVLGSATATADGTAAGVRPHQHVAPASSGHHANGPHAKSHATSRAAHATAPLTSARSSAPKISNAAACTIGDGGLPGASVAGTSITVSGTVTWQANAGCPDGYVLANDLTIPTGASVTLAPGTILYLVAGHDPAYSGEWAASEADPTSNVDIIVQGTFNVAGSTNSLATITSSNTDPTCVNESATCGTAVSGDWGDLFYDGTGSNTPAGSLSNANVAYGNEVLADHYTLPISNANINHMAGNDNSDSVSGAGLDIRHLPAGATETIAGLTYDGTGGDGTGVTISSYEDNDMAGHAYHGNGMSVTVSDSTISGYYPLYVEDDANAANDPSGAGNASVNFTLTNDHLNAMDGSYAFSPEAYQGSNSSSGSAMVTGTMSGSVLGTDDSSDSEGFVPYAETLFSSAPAGTSSATCSNGTYGSCVGVTLTNDQVSGHGDGVDAESYVDSGTDTTSTGDALLAVSSTGGSFTSSEGNPLYEEVEQTGAAGNANNFSTFSGTPTTGEYGDWVKALADGGSATSSPSFTNGSIQGGTSSFAGLYNEVDAADSGNNPGVATGSPTLTNTPVTGWDSALYNYVNSNEGAATGSPVITSAGTWTATADNYEGECTFFSAYCPLIDNEVYASQDGPADGTGVVNDAVASPQISGMTGTSAYADTLDNVAESEYGAATANPSVTDSTLSAGGQCSASDCGSDGFGLVNAAVGADNSDFTGTGAATADPSLAGTTLKAFEDGIGNFAWSGYGAATADPTVTTDQAGTGSSISSSTGVSSDTAGCYIFGSPGAPFCYYGLDNEALSTQYNDGGDTNPPASAEPTINGSTMSSYFGIYTCATAQYVDATGPGSCDSGDNSGTSSADANTTIINSNIDAYLNPVTAQAFASGNGATEVLTNFSGSTITGRSTSDSDYGVFVNASSPYNGTGTSHVGGTVKKTTIQSQDDAFYATGMSGSGALSFDTTFDTDTLTSNQGEALFAEMTPCGSGGTNGGTVKVDPTITGGSFSAPSDNNGYGIDLEAAGYGTTPTDVIEVAPQITGTNISSYYDGVYLNAYDTDSFPGSVHVGGSVNGATINSSDGDGIDAVAECTYTCSAEDPTGVTVDTSSNDTTIVSSYDAGFFEADSDAVGTPATAAPHVTSDKLSTWDSNDGNGVTSIAESDSDGSATNAPTIAGMHLSGAGSDDWCGDGGGYCGYTYSDTGGATTNATVESNLVDNKWQGSDINGIDQETYADSESGIATDTSTLSGNTVNGLIDGGDGGFYSAIYDYAGAATGNEHVAPTISNNVVTAVGQGIHVETQGHSPTGQAIGQEGSFYPTITGNTVVDTGGFGIWVQGVLANISGNWQAYSGQAVGPLVKSHIAMLPAGIEVDGAHDAGSVTCNAVTGNSTGVRYFGNAADPATNQNAFEVGGTTNGPVNLTTNNEGLLDATNNWWGPYSPAQLTASILPGLSLPSLVGVLVGSTGGTFVNGTTDGAPNGNPNGGLAAPPACVPTGPSVGINPTGGGGGGGGQGGGGLIGGGGGGGGAELLACPSDPAGTAPNGANPLVVTVSVPGGTSCDGVTFSKNNGGQASSGFSALGTGVQITAPLGSLNSPLQITFQFPAALLPPGTSPSDVVVYRDGTPVANPCTSTSPLSPDPCEVSATESGGVVTITILSSHASTWTFATPTTAGSSRLAGGDREATAIAVSQASFANGAAGAVVLARSDSYPDALSGAPLALAKNAPILLTSPTNLDAPVAAEIQRVLPAGGTVYLLGGTSALSSLVAQQLTVLGYNVSRIAGADRYGTSVAVAQAVGSVSTILLANGVNFPDALAASAATGNPGTVILLTNGSTLPTAISAFLSAHAVPMFAIGGPAASADPAATPLVGADRYATAVAVAQQFFKAPTAAGLATGLNFPDALAAGPRLAHQGMPLLLTDPATLPASVSAYLTGAKSTLMKVEVFGGTAAVSAAVQQAAQSAVS